MRKTILQTIVATFAIALLLSSCLGSNDNKMKSENALCYIKTTEGGVKYAVGNNMNFTSEFVENNLKLNKFYYLNFEVSTANVSPQGIFSANHVSFHTNHYPIAEGVYYRRASSVGFPVVTEPEYKPNARSVSVVAASPDSNVDDHWVFKYTCEAYKEDVVVNDLPNDLGYGETNLRLVATLYDDKQYEQSTNEEVGGKLEPNKAVVYLHIERRDKDKPVNTTVDKISYTGETSINLSQLRSYFIENFPPLTSGSSERDHLALIQFRYAPQKGKSATEEPAEVSLGRLDLNSPEYYMYIASEDERR